MARGEALEIALRRVVRRRGDEASSRGLYGNDNIASVRIEHDAFRKEVMTEYDKITSRRRSR